VLLKCYHKANNYFEIQLKFPDLTA